MLAELDVISVEPCHVSDASTAGTWPCGNCGRQHPVQRNYIVSYRAQPIREIRQTLVCEDCADDLRRTHRREVRDERARDRRDRRDQRRADAGDAAERREA